MTDHDALRGIGDNGGPLMPGTPEYDAAIIEAVKLVRYSSVNDALDPAEIGAIGEDRPLARKKAIDACRSLALIRLAQMKADAHHDAVLIDFIAAHSDNKFGRCAEPTSRMEAVTGLKERTIRGRLKALADAGIIGREVRGSNGDTTLYWLTYDRAAVGGSSYDLFRVIAPHIAGHKVGRPPKLRVPLTDVPETETPARLARQGSGGNPGKAGSPGFCETPERQACQGGGKPGSPGGRKDRLADTTTTRSTATSHNSLDSPCETRTGEIEARRASASRSPQAPAFPDLFDASPVPGVTFPTAVLSAIEGGTAKIAAETLIDAVKAQLRAGASREQIEASMRKAVVDLASTETKPAPSALMRKVLTYVERAVSQRVAQPAYVPGTTTERIQNIPFGYADPDAPCVPPPSPISGVDYPSVILGAIEGNQAAQAARNLNQAVDAALRRQVPAAQIAAAMRNAVAWLSQRCRPELYPNDLLIQAQQSVDREQRFSSGAFRGTGIAPLAA